MAKITQSYLLRCGFKYVLVKEQDFSTKKRYSKILKFHKNIWNFFYEFTTWVYDEELDGEIPFEIIAAKIFGGWAFNINGEITVLKKIEEFEELLQIFPDENLNFIYIIKSEMGYKIGRSKNIDDRGAIFNVKLPFEWEFKNIFAVSQSKKMEKFPHFILKHYHKNGEWFIFECGDIPVVENFILSVKN